MSAQHTPGPWSTDGDQVSPELEDANDGFLIARTFGSETIANARLIAAAPDLLSVVQAVNAAAKGGHDTIALLLELHRIGILADAALVKVTAA